MPLVREHPRANVTDPSPGIYGAAMLANEVAAATSSLYRTL